MLALLTTALVVTALAVFVLGSRLVARLAARRRGAGAGAAPPAFDPGRERRAEQRARELLRSCVNEVEWAMYRDLGFIRLDGRSLPDAPGSDGAQAPYAYLIYPHKPIVAYVPATGRLLSEYCVNFPDVSGGGRTRLPASDDVLAKWMALTSDEARVIGRANMHLVGRQHDPGHVRRDIWRLSEWERLRAGKVGARAA
ncbi:MAG TPA: hypothetical protein VHF88_08270 [Thermoleophilaceae bacterium]|nr:hypothetical protein [Thermoleophilaceae bacterium]